MEKATDLIYAGVPSRQKPPRHLTLFITFRAAFLTRQPPEVSAANLMRNRKPPEAPETNLMRAISARNRKPLEVPEAPETNLMRAFVAQPKTAGSAGSAGSQPAARRSSRSRKPPEAL